MLEIAAPVMPDRKLLDQWKALVEGKCVGAQVLNALWADIRTYYRREGYIPSGIDVDNPEETPSLLKVRIKLLICGKIHFQGKEVTDSWNVFPGETGRPLKVSEIDQTLENLQKGGYRASRVEIRPSADQETADLQFHGDGAAFKHVSLGVDDQGQPPFGKSRWLASLSSLNALQLDESLSLSMTRQQEDRNRTETFQFQGEIPFGFHSFVLGAQRNHYVIPFALPGVSASLAGGVRQESLGWSWVLHRDAWMVGRITAGMDWRKPEQETRIDGSAIRNESASRKMVSFSWGVSSEMLFRQSGTAMSVSLNNRHGLSHFGSHDDVEDIRKEEPHAQYRSSTFDLVLTKVLAIRKQPLEAMVFGRVFYSSTGLYPAEQLELLSSTTVDGFPGQSAEVDRGWLYRAQLRTRFALPKGWGVVPSIAYARAGGKRLTDMQRYRVSSYSVGAVAANATFELTARLTFPHRGKEGMPKEPLQMMYGLKAIF